LSTGAFGRIKAAHEYLKEIDPNGHIHQQFEKMQKYAPAQWLHQNNFYNSSCLQNFYAIFIPFTLSDIKCTEIKATLKMSVKWRKTSVRALFVKNHLYELFLQSKVATWLSEHLNSITFSTIVLQMLELSKQ
jgi:hypothetical protein